MESGEIPDPYFDRNELSVQWVGREDWIIEREIEASPELLACKRVIIELECLDTVAELRINGVLLGRSENMFRPFRADARALLRPGANLLSVIIRSAEEAAARAAAAHPYPVPHSIYPITSPHRNFIRKAQCMSGWDWGPCLLSGGIYGVARLIGIDGPAIRYVSAVSRRTTDSSGRDRWSLDVGVSLDMPAASPVVVEASLPALAGPLSSRRVELRAGEREATLELEAEGAEAWWPAGYGAQALYDLEIRLECGGESDKASRRIGFRELTLVNEPDEAGSGMTFRVNGRDVFCKGANWVPSDALPSRWTRERYDELVSAARWANMNCLRVWGGGRYEAEDFYDLCDEKGILVWQDFMFACALYPSSPAFLAEVEAEVAHQVRRLSSRACVALWCGNNENLGALGWYPESKSNPMRYIVDYDRLTEGTIGRIVRELDPGRPWWPSSPSGGPSDYSDNWHGDGRGDMHFWSVWHEGKSFSEYLTVKPRFCSEFGFQSFPNPATVASFAPRGERNVACPSMEHHQRHDRGNSIIIETMSRYFRLPSGETETLYLSQAQQAMAIATAVDYWRSQRPRCMGTLYWQLNDVWPVSSWSSLDYDGSMKLLHYEARRFFDPFRLAIIGPVPGGSALFRVVAVNDGIESLVGRAILRVRRLDGEPIAEYRSEFRIEGESAVELSSFDPASLPCPREQAFIEVVFEPSCPTQASYARSAVSFLTEPKRCSLPDPGIESELDEAGGGIRLRIGASRPAFFVAPWLDPDGAVRGSFDDAAFHLMPGEERVLRFIPFRGTALPGLDELRRSLRILHLRASYE